jgi:hypothetical protein
MGIEQNAAYNRAYDIAKKPAGCCVCEVFDNARLSARKIELTKNAMNSSARQIDWYYHRPG